MKPESRLAARPEFDERDLDGVMDDIRSVLRSGRLILGEQTTALEQEFAQRVGVKHAVAVSSCSAALEIALRTFGAEGREVVVPTNTFVATAVSVQRAGGYVVFADCSSSGGLDADAVMRRVSDNTAAVIVVHIAGMVDRDVLYLRRECERRGISLIEDCAHAQGAALCGDQAGALADAGCFSFYPTKITTCGVGGMLTTNLDAVANHARSLRHHGQGSSLESIVNAGNDWLMDEMRAVLCRAQLRRLDEVLSMRSMVAEAYAVAINGCADMRIQAPVTHPWMRPSWYKYPVALSVPAAPVRELMTKRGIETGPLYWPPAHMMPIFKHMSVSMPNAEDVLARRLCLPMHALVDPADCAEIVKNLSECLDEVGA